MTGLTDITHFALFRILDYLQADCEQRNKNEPLDQIKYGDIFNFAATCKGLRRIVRLWSQSMYDQMEINLLQEEQYHHLTVKFEEIHKSLKGATEKKVDKYLDIYVRAMMKNPLLRTFELSHKTLYCWSYHEYVFDEILLAICGQSKRAVLFKDRLPIVKEVTVDIAGKLLISPIDIRYLIKDFYIPDRPMSGRNLIALASTRISKLSLTASFAISDLTEFCARNPALTTLEISEYAFSDHGKLSEIVGHCPALKQLKFVMSDNARDRDYVKLALLDKLTHLEIRTPSLQMMDFGWDEDHDVEDIASEQTRMDPAYEEDPPLENTTALLLLIKALSERKKSKLIQLRLKFMVNDETVQAIAQLKGLRLLECGFCHSKSITYLRKHLTLNRLIIRNRDHIITDDIADLLRKHITVSNSFTKMFLNPRGHLYIDTKDAILFGFVNLNPLLNLENLKSLGMSKDLVLAMETQLPLFLERGVQIKVDSNLTIILQPETRDLRMLYDSDYLEEEIPLPRVKNLRSVQLISLQLPSIRFLESLVRYHRDTLLGICIQVPNTIFELPKNHFLSESLVVALTYLTNLRKVSCGIQELVYIQRLVPLKELEEIEVMSEHDPQEIPSSLVPLLINCRKLSSFKIKVPVSGINQALLGGLQDAVIGYRDPDTQSYLDICLRITESTTAEQQVGI